MRFRKECWFDPGLGYHFQKTILILLEFLIPSFNEAHATQESWTLFSCYWSSLVVIYILLHKPYSPFCKHVLALHLGSPLSMQRSPSYRGGTHFDREAVRLFRWRLPILLHDFWADMKYEFGKAYEDQHVPNEHFKRRGIE